LTPQALSLIDKNQNNPSWSIPRQVKLALPKDPMRPLSSEVTTDLGPIYDPETETMSSGIINTYSISALAETRFGLLRSERRIGSVREHNRRSVANREAVVNWVKNNDLLDLGVKDETRRGAAVTLLKVKDADIDDAEITAKVIAKSKQLLGFEGMTHANGEYEKGLDVARHVNAYPGTPGDYRAWIGGTRDESDIIALLNNIYYAYHRARIVVAEDLLADQGVEFEPQCAAGQQGRDDSETFAELRGMSEAMAAFWGAMDATADEDRRQEMAKRYASQMMLDINRYQVLLDELEIQGAHAD
jgi:hypothetical protein